MLNFCWCIFGFSLWNKAILRPSSEWFQWFVMACDVWAQICNTMCKYTLLPIKSKHGMLIYTQLMVCSSNYALLMFGYQSSMLWRFPKKYRAITVHTRGKRWNLTKCWHVADGDFSLNGDFFIFSAFPNRSSKFESAAIIKSRAEWPWKPGTWDLLAKIAFLKDLQNGFNKGGPAMKTWNLGFAGKSCFLEGFTKWIS